MILAMNYVPYLLCLHRRLNLTKPRFDKLNQFFAGDWQKAYEANLKDWQAAGISKQGLEKFFGTPQTLSPQQEQDFLSKSEAILVTCENGVYPDLWQNIAQAPAVFFYRGNGDNLNTKSMAVVGSRKMTDYGQRVLKSLIKPSVEKGVTVVSGLAYGVDTAAHRLALECNVPTVAVLGNGIDEIYPKRNTALATEILAAGGTIVSEYLPRTEARPEYFPQRNRLVTGLAEATIVVEGALKSGSLISARLANEFGRTVWAVPGDVFRLNSQGCNQLIFQGEAGALTHSKFLLESLNLTNTTSLQKVTLSAEEQGFVKVLRQKNEWLLEEFIQHLSLPIAEVSAQLIMLEMKGVIKTTPNKVYYVA